jgi:hypothetical protein
MLSELCNTVTAANAPDAGQMHAKLHRVYGASCALDFACHVLAGDSQLQPNIGCNCEDSCCAAAVLCDCVCDVTGVRARTANLVGNMCRHSGYFYTVLHKAGVLPPLIQLCSDSDKGARWAAARCLAGRITAIATFGP